MVRHIGAALRLLVDVATNPQSPIAAIDRLGLEHGRLVIDDRMSDQTKIYDGFNLTFAKAGGETQFKLSAEGPNGRWTITANSRGQPGTVRSLKIETQNFSLDEISLVTGLRSVGVDFDMPLAAKFALQVAPDGGLTEIAGTLSMGSGYLRIDDADDEPKMVEAIDASFHWDRAARTITVDEARLETNETTAVLTGTVAAPVNEGEPWTIDLKNSEPVVVGSELPGEAPIQIDNMGFQGKLDLEGKTFVIDRLAFNGPDCGFAMAGAVDWKAGPHLRLGASISPTPARVAVRLWPSFLISDVRTWFLYHMKDGIIQTAKLQLDLNAEMIQTMRLQHAPPDDASKLDFTVTNGSFDFLPGVPPIHDLVGEGHITGRTTTFIATSGILDAGGRKLTMSEGSFRITDADVKPTPAEMTARVSGSIEAVGDLLSRDALKPYANLPIDASTMKGQIDGKLVIGVKLGTGGGRPEDTTFATNATATNFSADKVVGNERLENATLNVVVDPVGLRATGQGRMFYGPATIELVKPIGKQGEATVSVVLDDAARVKQGLTAFSNVTGPITAHINAPLTTGPNIKAQVDIDLLHANVETAPGVVKPAGKPGKASFSLTANDDKLQLDQVVYDAQPAQARGTIEISADQSNISARFTQVKLSPGDDMKVDLTKNVDGLKFVVRGTTVDARPFLKQLTSPHPDATATPGKETANSKEAASAKEMEIDLKSAVLTGFNKQVLSNVELHVAKHGEQVRQFALVGRFGRDGVDGTMTNSGTPSPQMKITTQDAGALLGFIDLYKHMEGGQLSVTMRLGEGAMAGTLDIKDFVLRDEPALARLVAESSQQQAYPTATAQPTAARFDANAAHFRRLHVNFQRVGSRLDLRDGGMNGDGVGLTVDGSLDITHDKVNLEGTYVPLFALNNLFAKVPFFGTLLAGGDHEGLFGANYSISGSLSQPVLNVNAFSAIAPGIFRKAFPAGVGSEANPAWSTMPAMVH